MLGVKHFYLDTLAESEKMVLLASPSQKRTVFGVRLRQLREAAGLSQTALGEKVGIVYQNVAKYERGANHPTWPMVVALAEALGVTPDSFLDDTEPPHDVPPPVEAVPPNDGKKGTRSRGGYSSS